MTKDRLARQLAEMEEGMTVLSATVYINKILSDIEVALRSGNSVTFRDFGRFSVKRTKGGKCRSNLNGKEYPVKSKLKVWFKPCARFRDLESE